VIKITIDLEAASNIFEKYGYRGDSGLYLKDSLYLKIFNRKNIAYLLINEESHDYSISITSLDDLEFVLDFLSTRSPKVETLYPSVESLKIYTELKDRIEPTGFSIKNVSIFKTSIIVFYYRTESQVVVRLLITCSDPLSFRLIADSDKVNELNSKEMQNIYDKFKQILPNIILSYKLRYILEYDQLIKFIEDQNKLHKKYVIDENYLRTPRYDILIRCRERDFHPYFSIIDKKTKSTFCVLFNDENSVLLNLKTLLYALENPKLIQTLKN